MIARIGAPGRTRRNSSTSWLTQENCTRHRSLICDAVYVSLIELTGDRDRKTLMGDAGRGSSHKPECVGRSSKRFPLRRARQLICALTINKSRLVLRPKMPERRSPGSLRNWRGQFGPSDAAMNCGDTKFLAERQPESTPAALYNVLGIKAPS
jgi:hypothetical protein